MDKIERMEGKEEGEGIEEERGRRVAPLQYGNGLNSSFSQTSRPLVHKLYTLSRSKVSTKFLNKNRNRLSSPALSLARSPAASPSPPGRSSSHAANGEGLGNIALDCISTDQSDLTEAIRS